MDQTAVPSACARHQTSHVGAPSLVGANTTRGQGRKIRSDARFEQLSLRQRERLHFWLDDENRSYADVVERVHAEFGLSVGKSTVARYWRRHLLPESHREESEIAAAFAAVPAGVFDAATLNQAKALAWTFLTEPVPRVQDAARLLDLVHRADRLALAHQRVALEERRVALREAQAAAGLVPSASVRPQAPQAVSRSSSDDASNPPAALGQHVESGAAPASSAVLSGPSPVPIPKNREPGLPGPPARHNPGLFPNSSPNPPGFPGYSGLFQFTAEATLTQTQPRFGPPIECPDPPALAA